MSTKPILFSTPMVQAILDGRKTMTRRAIKPQPVRNGAFWELGGAGWSGNTVTPVYGHSLYNRMPHKPGDVLWVRETWSPVHVLPKRYLYKADAENGGEGDGLPIRWRPSIHMPREAARLFLRVVSVRVEKLQDMPLFDVWDEGTPQMPGNLDSDGAVNHWDFRYLWDSLNAKRGYGWDTNPWVWVYSFERVDKPNAWRNHRRIAGGPA